MKQAVYPIAFIGGLFLQIPAPLKVLCTLMLIDIVLGVLCRFIDHGLESEAMARGLIKKAVVILIVLSFMVFDMHYAEPLQLHFASAIALVFTANELLSILEHAAKLGVPIPEWILVRLRKYQGSRDEESR